MNELIINPLIIKKETRKKSTLLYMFLQSRSNQTGTKRNILMK